ncbi:MAG: hypothetical protein IGS23_02395 [Rivularia sp. T60_A2020_040]|nr:hypothetical protein [Rivularia sp. T60_A2020_040]
MFDFVLTRNRRSLTKLIGTAPFNSIAEEFALMGSPAFACSPDKFPDLMATAIQRQDIAQWAAANDIVTTRD